MRLIQKIITMFKKKEVTVVTTRDLAKHMQETRTMVVPNYDEKKMREPKISMFHWVIMFLEVMEMDKYSF